MIGCRRFAPDVSAQFSQPSYRRAFSKLLIEIEDQKQIGHQSGQYLKQHAMWISGDKMVDLQMTFPPGKKEFNFPSQGKNEGDLFGGQVGSIGGHPIDFAPRFEADQKEGLTHGRVALSESNLGKEKNLRPLGDGEGFEDFLLGVFSDAGDEMLAFVDPGVKALVIDLASIQHAGISFVE